jgi:hypothetical protein
LVVLEAAGIRRVMGQYRPGLATLTEVRQVPADQHTAIGQRYPRLQSGPFGKGVFAHARRSGNANPSSPDEIEAWARHPYIAGTQLAYSWEELEPARGQYRWDLLDRDMHVWASHGKKVWLEISTANKRDVGRRGNKGSPEWIFDAGVPMVGSKGTAGYPVFWDPKYKEVWEKFIRAFATKFDGDPRIEFVSTGGYSGGSEPSLSQDDNEPLMEQWAEFGFDGFTPTGIYLNGAIKPVLRMYANSFRRTGVAQIIHTKSDFDQAMNGLVADHKFLMLSNGFSCAKFDGKTRQEWRLRRETYDVKTGFAEWGPLGRSIDKVRRNRDPHRKAKLMDCYRSAIGSDSDPDLMPASRLSYLPLGDRIPQVETIADWDAALKWAWEHLE